MSVIGVRRAKAALSSGCKSHPAIAPAGSHRSSHGDPAPACGIPNVGLSVWIELPDAMAIERLQCRNARELNRAAVLGRQRNSSAAVATEGMS